MGLFTITWEDYYDYSRCPKILSFKCAGLRVRRVSKPVSQGVIRPYDIGIVGEEAVSKFLGDATRGISQGTLREDFVREAGSSLYIDMLERVKPKLPRGVDNSIREAIKRLVDETVKGLVRVAEILADKYGELELAGRGEIKSPALPSFTLPDFLFKVKGRDEYVLLEVKNTIRQSSCDFFQASFYASIARQGGIAVKEHIYFHTGESRLTPLYLLRSDIDVFLVYLRLRRVKEVRVNYLDFKRDVRGIWEAKLLGLMGKQPDTPRVAYCRKCRWKRYCSHYCREKRELTGSLEHIPMPPYLLLSKSALEMGLSLDLLWYYRYVSSLLERTRRRVASNIAAAIDSVIRGLERNLERRNGLIKSKIERAVERELCKRIASHIFEAVSYTHLTLPTTERV